MLCSSADKNYLRQCGAQPTGGQFIRKYHLTSVSAVQRSLSALLEKDVVTSGNMHYSIYDYFPILLAKAAIMWQRRVRGDFFL